jgi:hypothetical protein
MHRLYTLALLLLFSIAVRAQNTVGSGDKRIAYTGRVVMTDSAAQLSWPGTTVEVNFEGTGLMAELRDQFGENTYNIVLDGRVVGKLTMHRAKKLDTLVSELAPGKHHLELFKRTEAAMGKTWLYSLQPTGTLLAPSPRRKRKIVFFGDSITCGYAVEDSSGKDRGTAEFENGYISYAAIAARHFDAEFHSISKSGIGIMVSWFPVIMPEMYDLVEPTDSLTKWDFTQFQPQLVVINLFQNDSWIAEMPANEQFKARFGTTKPSPERIVWAYRDFLRSIRAKFPDAEILCALGNMDATERGSVWPGYITQAVASLGDAHVYTHFFPYKNTPGHPNPKEQQVMADDLIGYIHEHLGW